MDGTKLDQLRQFVVWEIEHNPKRHIAEWALAQIEELIHEKTELQIELAACAAVLPGTQYMDEPDGGAPDVSVQLRRMRDDLHEQLEVQRLVITETVDDAAYEWAQYVEVDSAPVTLQHHMADALAKLAPN